MDGYDEVVVKKTASGPVNLQSPCRNDITPMQSAAMHACLIQQYHVEEVTNARGRRSRTDPRGGRPERRTGTPGLRRELVPALPGVDTELAALLERYPTVRHIKVEDGPGQALGRSFRVKIWPNLVFLRDGQIIRQLARPDQEEVADAFKAVAAPQ